MRKRCQLINVDVDVDVDVDTERTSWSLVRVAKSPC